MKAVIYCRVSDPRQALTLSLGTQEGACREYCRREGYDVDPDAIFVEPYSAKTTERPEFVKLLAYCRKRKGSIHALVVYSLNRFARNSADHHAVAGLLRGLGISIKSATEPIDDTPAGKFMESIVAAVSQFDNDMRSARVTAGMKSSIQKGRWIWLAPLGYINTRRTKNAASLALDPDRAPLVRRAFEMCAESDRPVSEILRLITGCGLRTRSDKPLVLKSFYELLQNEAYIGWVQAKGWPERARGDYEPLISEEVFYRVQKRISSKRGHAKLHTRHRPEHPDFPLRRFVRCRRCGVPLTGSWSTSRSSLAYPYYHCRRGCEGVRASKGALEDQFLRLLDSLRPTDECLAFLNHAVLDAWQDARRNALDARNAVERRLAEVRTKLARLDEAYLYERSVDQATYLSQRDKLREQETVIQFEVSDATIESYDVEGLLRFGEHLLTHASALWSASDPEQRRRIQTVLFPTGLAWSNEGFGTAVTCLAFYNLEENLGGLGSVVDQAGIEPATS